MLEQMGSPAKAVAEAHPIASQNSQLSETALTLRPGRSEDAAECGRICFEAFQTIASQHNFPEDFPSAGAASEFFEFALSQPETYVVVAELDGRVVGSNMSWEQTPIAGIGPITVATEVQNGAVGRRLMTHVLDRSENRNCLGIRLVQAAYHNRSLALYTKLGFRSREPLSVFQGLTIGTSIPGRFVRPANTGNIEACVRLHEHLHGFSRSGDLSMAVAQGSAKVVERNGQISGYATDIGFFAHAIGKTNHDIIALIGSATGFSGPGFLVPTRNTALMHWCLNHGLRIVQPMTLMTRGYYRKPKGAYLPSILF